MPILDFLQCILYHYSFKVSIVLSRDCENCIPIDLCYLCNLIFYVDTQLILPIICCVLLLIIYILIRHLILYIICFIYFIRMRRIINRQHINSLSLPCSRQASNVTSKAALEDDNDGITEFPLAMRTTGPETGRNFAPAVLERVKSLPRKTAPRCLSKRKEEEE